MQEHRDATTTQTQAPESTTRTSARPVQRSAAPGRGIATTSKRAVQRSAGAGTGTSVAPAGGGAGGSSGASWMSEPGMLGAMGYAVQRDAAGGDGGGDIHGIAAQGIAGPSQSLPHLDTIQNSFGGHDVSSTQAHTGGAASQANEQMGANAYATGDHVAFRGTPDLHTAAHEAAHVVQQRSGVNLSGGVGQVGDSYERHADAVADKVVAGESASGLLDEMAPQGGASGGVQQKAVQLDGGDETPATGTENATGGTENATGGTENTTGDTESAGDEPAQDLYEAFKASLDSGDATQIRAAWGACTGEDKAKLKDDGPTQRRVMHALHKESVPILSEGGVDWSDGVTTQTVFLMDDFAEWYSKLLLNGLLWSFLDAEPKKHHLSLEQAQKLQTWVAATNTAYGAQTVFHKVYPTLNESSPYAGEEAAAWTKPHVERLYNTLSQYLPVGHAQTLTGGFTLLSKKDGATLGYAYYNPGIYRCVLPESSANQTGNSGHRMSGGSGGAINDPTSTVDQSYTNPEGNAGANTALDHFDASALHEVGHGVGHRMGGDDYALNASSFPKWTGMNRATWATELWEAGLAAPGGTAPTGLDPDAELAEADAKSFFSKEIESGANSYASSAPRNEIVQYVSWRYSNQRLYRWWDHMVQNRIAKSNAYRIDDDAARVKGEWTYTYVSRWGASPYAKLNTEAYTNRVSWYSLSSPKEWFAEQYTQYYRTEKTGGGKIDASTMDLLNRLDQQEFVPTTEDGNSGVVIQNMTGGDEDRAGDNTEQPAQTLEERPLMFPW